MPLHGNHLQLPQGALLVSLISATKNNAWNGNNPWQQEAKKPGSQRYR